VLYYRFAVFRIRNEVLAMTIDVEDPILDETEAIPPVPAPGPVVLTTAELAECTCPEFCERDHDLD
jgi:hypothetical protein